MENKKITEDYSSEMAKFLCSQLYGTVNPAYLKCDNLEHQNCNCQEVYSEKLNTYDGTLEKYLARKIFDFIED